MSPDQLVVYERRDRIGIVTLNRPDALNALSGAMAEQVREAFESLHADREVWAVVLRAEGEKAFCVGADLKERAGFSLGDYYANRRSIRGMFQSIRQTPQPTIAAVFGFALGGGCELALSCDLLVAADGTKLGLPEMRVGLLPAGGGTQLMTRKLGPARAKELMFTGRRFDAAEGKEWGLVSRVVPRNQLDDAALELAAEVTKSSPVAVREGKAAIDAALGLPIEDGIEREDQAWRVVIESKDRTEGIAAFNEKRDPSWNNE